MGFLRDQREQRRLRAVVDRDAALLNGTLGTYSEHVGTFEPEFGPHRVAALRAAMVGAASSLVQLRARASRSTVDLSDEAGPLDHASGTYLPGLFPTAVLREAREESLEPLFRILTWAHMTDVISEFWWPDYYWETANVAAMFGIRGPEERLVIAYGPNPGSVFHEADLLAEYSRAKMRAALCGMLDRLTDKRIAHDDIWVDLLFEGWSEDFWAGEDEMFGTLKEASPDGYPFTTGVVEAREKQGLQRNPTPRMDEAAVQDVEGACKLCEEGLALLSSPPNTSDPLLEDIGALITFYTTDIAKADARQGPTVINAILAGYIVAEAEHKQGLGGSIKPVASRPIEKSRATALGELAFQNAAEIANAFAYHRTGWLAVQRWSFTHVSLDHRVRTGEGHNLDLFSPMAFGYGLWRAAEAMR